MTKTDLVRQARNKFTPLTWANNILPDFDNIMKATKRLLIRRIKQVLKNKKYKPGYVYYYIVVDDVDYEVQDIILEDDNIVVIHDEMFRETLNDLYPVEMLHNLWRVAITMEEDAIKQKDE